MSCTHKYCTESITLMSNLLKREDNTLAELNHPQHTQLISGENNGSCETYSIAQSVSFFAKRPYWGTLDRQRMILCLPELFSRTDASTLKVVLRPGQSPMDGQRCFWVAKLTRDLKSATE